MISTDDLPQTNPTTFRGIEKEMAKDGGLMLRQRGFVQQMLAT